MRVLAKTPFGHSYDLCVEPSSSISSLAKEIVEKENLPSFSQVKLVSKRKVLDPDASLADLNICEGDSVLALFSRPAIPPNTQGTTVEENDSVTRAMIKQETGKHFQPDPNADEAKLEAPSASQLQDLISLFLGLPRAPRPGSESGQEDSPSANASPSQPAAPAEPPAEPPLPTLPDPDPEALKQLTDMGFPEEHVKKALLLNGNNSTRATEWLLEHMDDPTIGNPLTDEEIRRVAPAQTSPTFMTSAELSQQLREMGFQDNEIEEALRATNNNSEAAIAWLLGDREPVQAFRADVNNPFVRAIMSNTEIQRGMNNPRVFGAFQAFLENPAEAAERYLDDPEIGPVISEVARVLRGTQ